MSVRIKIFTTGGTIDKVYFDANSRYEVGDPQIGQVLENSHVTFDYEVETLFKKDSLDLTDEDRREIKERIELDPESRIVVTHGTDTMDQTARALRGIAGKTIVLTGSLQPARFVDSNAIFNIGCAIAAVQTLAPGVYVTMNGRIFEGHTVRKNRERSCFESTLPSIGDDEGPSQRT